MKKIISLIFATIFFINFSTVAQTIPCNADFTMQITTNFPPHRFVPAVNIGMPSAIHYWDFDDNTVSIDVSPFHSFPQNGVYNAMHIITINPTNPSIICRDTSYLTITIGAPYECNLQAGFVSYTTPGAISLSKTFLNTSNGANYYNNGGIPTDSVIWNFGDGNSLVNFEGSHTYLNPGNYNVCVKVFKRRPNGTLIPGCFSEFCDTVNVLPNTSNPTCLINGGFLSNNDTASYATPNTINFTNTTQSSTSIQAFHWTFGDGTSANNYQSPNHSYPAPGTYNVCLITVTQNTNCVDTFCKQVVVANPTPTCNLQANFNSNYVAGTNLLTKVFNNTSANAASSDSIRWTFGDGTSANTYNTTHTYPSYGVYNVCLRIIKRNPNGVLLPNCVSEFCKLDTILAPAPACNIQAFFTGGNDTTIANPPFIIQFFNASQSSAPIVAYLWNFGDGTSSFIANPVHTFTNPGFYTVCLKVRTADTACTNTFCKTFAIQSLPTPCNLNASFVRTNTTSPLTKVYTNTSVGISPTDSIRWTFGDGTSANTFNAAHTFANYGTYNVCLRIIKRNPNGILLPNCVRDTCITDTIQTPTPSCTLNAGYTRYITTPNPLFRAFTNTSIGASPTDSIRWNFGDGTSFNTYNATHTYTNPGIYTVCLRIIKRNVFGVLQPNCVSEKCDTVQVSGNNSCNIVPLFTNSSSIAAPNLVQFTNQSINILPGDSIIWNFGNSTANVVNVLNPVHTYATSGSYWICMRIVRPTTAGSPPCNALFCKGIIVTIPTPCNSVVANFNKIPSTVNFRTINFFNTSTFSGSGTVSAQWNFGDGTTSTSWSNVTHTYALAGTYYVCLRIQQGNCIKTKCDSIRVLAPSTPNCNNVIMSYSYVSDSLYQNRIRFTAISNIPTISQTWTITKIPTTATSGNIIINQNNPTYAFLDSGNYRVCLRGTFAGGCIKEYCSTIHINYNTPTLNTCNLQLFPNPASSTVNGTITLAQPLMLNAFVYNTLNMVVAQKQQQGAVGVNIVSVNIATLPTGLYLYRLYYGNQVCNATFMK